MAYERSGTGLEFDRVAFFSDAIFAIAMTLLVVGIGVPSDLDEGLREARPEIVSFFISFLVLGNYWLAHHRFFAQLARIDSQLMLYNLVYLAAIAFIPYPTALVGKFEDATVTFLMYAIALAVASLMETVMFARAHRTGAFRTSLSPAGFRFGVTASILPVLVFIASMPIAIWWSTTAGLVSWLSVFILEAVAQRWAPSDERELFG